MAKGLTRRQAASLVNRHADVIDAMIRQDRLHTDHRGRISIAELAVAFPELAVPESADEQE